MLFLKLSARATDVRPRKASDLNFNAVMSASNQEWPATVCISRTRDALIALLEFNDGRGRFADTRLQLAGRREVERVTSGFETTVRRKRPRPTHLVDEFPRRRRAS